MRHEKVDDLNNYEFTLTFALSGTQDAPARYLDALFEAGCDDAVVGTGMSGLIALTFNRDAQTASEAISSALRDVLQAIPDARLVEAKPDMVGLTDVAKILDCSRQNIRKYAVGHPNFPRPVVTGKFQLWHLWEVAGFDKFSMPDTLVDISRVTCRLNLDLQRRRLEARQG
jgi:hypothetical protein